MTEDVSREDDLHVLAGEYVLGVLEGEDRLKFETLLETSPEARAVLREWEGQFAPLNDAYPEIAPPEGVLDAVQANLTATGAVGARDGSTNTQAELVDLASARGKTREQRTASAPIPPQQTSPKGQPFAAAKAAPPLSDIVGMRFWQGYSALASAAVIGLAFMNLGAGGNRSITYAPITLTAQTQTNAAVFAYNAKAEALELRAHTFTHPQDTDLEAWLILGDAAPQTLGVLAGNTEGEIVIKLPKGARELLAGGAILAITQEPKGGAPRGIPTGPRLAAGEIQVS